ncbi:MAG: hypothetical protein GXC70_03465 [Sphingomonadaceae bacterium]|nr:hypothetical protein [Sphingomonadaceae bacterium]
MDMGTAMVIVAGIGAWYSLRSKGVHPLRRRSMDGEPQAEAAAPAGTARETELQREVEHLRERIHVLERIATDGRKPHALAAEIESLRDR